ncbi:MAG TPA: hypothetical protein VKV80_05195 [Streptosporangiaceae bacterium]|nr:hypothetical protein [Streptosporangiaceae bacterium]
MDFRSRRNVPGVLNAASAMAACSGEATVRQVSSFAITDAL